MFTRANRDTVTALPFRNQEDMESVRAWIGDCDEPVTAELIHDFWQYDEDTAEWLISSVPLAPNVLSGLSKHRNYYVRGAVALSPYCPWALLAALSNDRHWHVRARVARNPYCPVTVLERLIHDEEEYVRSDVACNPTCSRATLDALSEDSNEFVRYQVAGNPSCPAAVLVRLSRDDNEQVRWRVAQFARLLQEAT